MKHFREMGKRKDTQLFSARKTKGLACFSGAQNTLFSVKNHTNTWSAM